MLEWIPLNYYACAGLLNFVASFVLSIFVFSKNPKSRTNQTFSLFAFTVAGWSLCYFLWLNTEKSYLAEFYLRTLMVFVIFIPSTFTHFILTLTKVSPNRKIILGNYLISVFLGAMAYTKLFASDIGPFLIFPYWLKPRFFFFIHSIHFFSNVVFSHFLMLRAIKHQSGIFRNQVLYVFIGTAIGYTAGAINYLTWYRIPIPPFLNPLVSVYVALVGYAIFKYRLMDINLVFRSWLIFLPYAVISIAAFVIINFLLHNSLWINTGSVILLILGAPFIYQYLEKHSRAVIDSTIYKDKFTYIEKLENFIDKMALIPEEEDLFKQTIKNLLEIIGVHKAGIFLHDPTQNNYFLKTQIKLDEIGNDRISDENKLILWLKNNKNVFIKEETEEILEDSEIIPIRETLQKLGAAICIPAMIEDNLIGFIALGEKTSGEMYSHIDNRILKRLGNQLAVALDYKRIEAQLRKQEQSAVLAKNRLDVTTSMAYGLADRIRNDLFSIHMFLGELPKMIQQLENRLTVEEKKSLNNHCNLSSGGINKLIALSKEITNMCKPETHKLNKYEPGVIIDITAEIEEQFKADIKDKNIKLEKIIEGNPPGTYFDRDGIKNVLFHLLWNSIHAIPETRKGSISVKITGPIANSGREFIRILIEDNGIGIPEENANNIFNPFFTTKGTAGGTGLGLIMSQFIISQHEGHTGILRTVLGKGTTMYVDLPIIKDPPKSEIDYKDILGMFPGRRK